MSSFSVQEQYVEFSRTGKVIKGKLRTETTTSFLVCDSHFVLLTLVGFTALLRTCVRCQNYIHF